MCASERSESARSCNFSCGTTPCGVSCQATSWRSVTWRGRKLSETKSIGIHSYQGDGDLHEFGPRFESRFDEGQLTRSVIGEGDGDRRGADLLPVENHLGPGRIRPHDQSAVNATAQRASPAEGGQDQHQRPSSVPGQGRARPAVPGRAQRRPHRLANGAVPRGWLGSGIVNASSKTATRRLGSGEGDTPCAVWICGRILFVDPRRCQISPPASERPLAVSVSIATTGFTQRRNGTSALLGKTGPDKINLMRWDQPIRYASVSDIGFRRRNNQDSYAVRMCSDAEIWREHGHLLMVADGMGGHAVGELASKIAADTVCHTFYKIRNTEVPDALKQALETANAAINERGSLNRDFARMGTTCTALALCPQGAVIGHVGDSRLYRVRGDRIDQLTADHSVQWELMRQGRLRPDEVFLHESRHVITRSLGPEPVVQVDIEGPYAVLPGDVYLICSDGLTGHVQDAEIGIIASELPPPEACRMLVNLANLRGGSDNVTVVIARVANVAGSDAEEETAAPTPSLGWGWIITIWCLALLFVAGVVSFLFEHPLQGVCLLAAASFLESGRSPTGSSGGRVAREKRGKREWRRPSGGRIARRPRGQASRS